MIGWALCCKLDTKPFGLSSCPCKGLGLLAAVVWQYDRGFHTECTKCTGGSQGSICWLWHLIVHPDALPNLFPRANSSLRRLSGISWKCLNCSSDDPGHSPQFGGCHGGREAEGQVPWHKAVRMGLEGWEKQRLGMHSRGAASVPGCCLLISLAWPQTGRF